MPVYALGENSDGRLFYAMRLVRGETLKERIRRFHQAGSIGRQPVAFRQLLNHFVRICDIVAYAHSRGVLHRDLKPSNVMLGKFGETLVVDWGLAKPIEPSGDSQPPAHDEVKLRPISGSSVKGTMHGATLGTPQYMSPEQALGQLERVGRVSDVYSFGATLYCILTGSPPLADVNDVGAVLSRVALGDIAPPQSVKSDVPATLEAICMKAMAVRPEERYQSVRALEADMESWLADEPVQGVAEPWSRRLTTWERKHRTFVRIGAMALFAVALVSLVAAIIVNAARERAEEGRRQANDSSRIAEARKQEADRQRDALRRFNTHLTLDRGLGLLASNDRRAGLLWLARGLASAGPERPVRAGDSRQSRCLDPAAPPPERMCGASCAGQRGRLEPHRSRGGHRQRGRQGTALGPDLECDGSEVDPVATWRCGAGAGIHPRRKDTGDGLRRSNCAVVELGLRLAERRADASQGPCGFRRLQPR